MYSPCLYFLFRSLFFTAKEAREVTGTAISVAQLGQSPAGLDPWTSDSSFSAHSGLC